MQQQQQHHLQQQLPQQQNYNMMNYLNMSQQQVYCDTSVAGFAAQSTYQQYQNLNKLETTTRETNELQFPHLNAADLPLLTVGLNNAMNHTNIGSDPSLLVAIGNGENRVDDLNNMTDSFNSLKMNNF